MVIDENIYKLIVENVNQEIFVCDGDANIIFANPASIEINELDAKNVVGRNVRDLVKEGYFNESITLKVLKQKKPLNMLMTVKSGKQIVEVANPVFDDDGNIKLVVCTSSDVEAVNTLLDTLENQKAEIESLKSEMEISLLPAAEGPSSENARLLIERASRLEVPVLIEGESGTGKLSVARTIALSGPRKNRPLISVRCSSLSSDELDADIFGEEYTENGHSFIRKGKIELADTGTLIISEIDLLSPHLQQKFSTYLHSGTFTRAGSSQSVSCSTRLICTSAISMNSLIEDGTFNSALLYGLKSITIALPPLRERKQDISALVKLFISECNRKYNDRKIMSSSGLGVLTSYTWPGNLTEFSQVIESSYILTDGHIISGETVHITIYGSSSTSDTAAVICTDIIPLKEAKRQLEEQLVKRAYEVYKTTYKAAEVLKVDQSTVSKILKKYKGKK